MNLRRCHLNLWTLTYPQMGPGMASVLERLHEHVLVPDVVGKAKRIALNKS
jgi:hypothetical protein